MCVTLAAEGDIAGSRRFWIENGVVLLWRARAETKNARVDESVCEWIESFGMDGRERCWKRWWT